MILGMKSAAWLNGAQGTLGDLQSNGRYLVHLNFPQSAVSQAVAKNGNISILVFPTNLIRWPGAADRFSLRKLQDAAAWKPEAQATLQSFRPFLLLLTGGNENIQISMADVVSRLRLACDALCWSNEDFMAPVYAYLKRKLRHVQQRVQGGISSCASGPSKAVLDLVVGHSYYASLAEENELGDVIYFPAKLIAFKMTSDAVSMALETHDSSSPMIVYYRKGPMMFKLFVPKAEFERNPLGVIVLPPMTTGDLHRFEPPPADWSTYDSDMRDILSSLALQCLHFKMPPSLLPASGKESPFRISKGSNTTLHFVEFDYGMSFKPFFSDTSSACDAQRRDVLLGTSALREANRCFFIHLGVALGLHPVALQAIFRAQSDLLLKRIQLALSQKTDEDDQQFDVVKMLDASLQSVLQHNDMIDAPVLSAVWPQEFQELQNVRVLILTMGHAGPQPAACYLFSPSTPADSADSFNGIDVILKLQGMHFTLLRPQIEDASSSPIDQITDMYPDIVPIIPLHLQDGDAGDMVREVGRVQSLAELHSMHAPAVPAAAAPAPCSFEEPEPYD